LLPLSFVSFVLTLVFQVYNIYIYPVYKNIYDLREVSKNGGNYDKGEKKKGENVIREER
jgi:hypothetical protein